MLQMYSLNFQFGLNLVFNRGVHGLGWGYFLDQLENSGWLVGYSNNLNRGWVGGIF